VVTIGFSWVFEGAKATVSLVFLFL